MLLLVLALILELMGMAVYADVHAETAVVVVDKPANKSEHGGGHGGTPPEHFVFMELFTELIHLEIGGIWVKITELKPKVLHIQDLYRKGEKHEAYAKSLGISTEVITLGFLIEHFGVPELFISAITFSENWLWHLALSMAGVMLSTKAAVVIAETVEEAVEEKYQKDGHKTQPATSSPLHH